MEPSENWRWLRSKSAVVLMVATGCAVWSIAGGPLARPVGIVAVVVGVTALGHQLSALSAQRRRLADSSRRTAKEVDRLRASNARAITRSNQLADELRNVSARLATQEFTTGRLQALIRESVAAARADTRVLREQLDIRTVTEAIPARTAGEPLLTIAIPVYERPQKLRQCLQSIVANVEALGTDRIEVCVTDDASTDTTAAVAREFAERYEWIGFRANETNKGLELNLMEAVRPSTGRFILLLGSDDLLAPHGLRPLLETTAADAHDVVVCNKRRVDLTLEHDLPDKLGDTPPDVPPGEVADYRSPLDLARVTGIVSGFGFTSQVLWRRSKFLSVDPTRYVGLMVYPHLGLLLEAFPRSPVRFLNHRAVLQRTLTHPQKLAESIGTGEESFMAGGDERNHRWFGAGYAALIQRAIDRTDLEAEEFRDVPERLLEEPSMLDFIARNWQTAVDSGLRHDEAVVADAVRLFGSLRIPLPRGVGVPTGAVG